MFLLVSDPFFASRSMLTLVYYSTYSSLDPLQREDPVLLFRHSGPCKNERYVGAHMHPNGYQHGVSIQIFINLGQTFLCITCLLKRHCCDLNLGESLCRFTFFLFPDSGFYPLNGFDFFNLFLMA